MASAGDISTKLEMDASQYNSSMAKASSNTEQFKGTADKASGSSRKLQAAMSQGVYAVDDFAAGFSTGGLQGGIRGAANNISALAGLLAGPWGLAIAVAGTATIQLYQAFNKTKKEASDLNKELNEQLSIIQKRVQSQQQVRDVDSLDSARNLSKQRRDDLEILEAQRAELVKQQDAAMAQYEAAKQNGGFFGADTEEQEKKLADIGKKIQEIDNQRVQARSQLADIEQKQLEYERRAKYELSAEEKKQFAELQRQKEKAEEEEKKRRELAAKEEQKKQEQRQQLRDDLLEETNPREAQRQRIAKQLNERIAIAKEIRGEGDVDGGNNIARMAAQSALAQIASMNRSEPVDGPSDIGRGSQADLEAERQARLQAIRPSQKQTPEKQLAELKMLVQLGKKQVQMAERRNANTAEVGIGL